MLNVLRRLLGRLTYNVGEGCVCGVVAAFYVTAGVALWMIWTSTTFDLLVLKMFFEPKYIWVVAVAWAILFIRNLLVGCGKLSC